MNESEEREGDAAKKKVIKDSFFLSLKKHVNDGKSNWFFKRAIKRVKEMVTKSKETAKKKETIFF